MAGAGTGAGVAIVVGVRRNKRMQKQMGARRLVRLFLEEFMALFYKSAQGKTADAG